MAAYKMNKIYLVDDQPISNFITKKFLELEGYKGPVIDYTNSAEAFEIIANDENALVFLDINMPVMNGWDFMEAMKERQISNKIIILSSSTSKFDKDRAREYPFVLDYMVKPMNRQKFTELSKYLYAS
jgi:CheY-like chemotaxis protein